MATKFNLLKQANDRAVIIQEEDTAIFANLEHIAETTSKTVEHIAESVTHILANIANTALSGKPIKIMHLNSVAAFMAGVEAIANALPQSEDEKKKESTLRVLATAAVGPDGEINDATFPIIDIGARKDDLKTKYAHLLHAYVTAQTQGKPAGQELATQAKQLQTSIDRAMRSLTKPRSLAATGPGSTKMMSAAM